MVTHTDGNPALACSPSCRQILYNICYITGPVKIKCHQLFFAPYKVVICVSIGLSLYSQKYDEKIPQNKMIWLHRCLLGCLFNILVRA